MNKKIIWFFKNGFLRKTFTENSLAEKLFFRRPVSNRKGVAILQALFLVTLVSLIVTQVSFEVGVEYSSNAHALQRIRAYRAAKAAVGMSLLRIKIYNKVMRDFGSQLGDMADMAKMIYQLPFSWPLALPADLNAVDKDALNKITKASYMSASYSSTIQPEDLLNINDLDSPAKSQQARIQEKLIELIKDRMENDEEWADRNKGIVAEEIVNNIKDWIDPDTQGANGGSESSLYGDLKEYDDKIKDRFPPNRHFRTIDEIRMVPGVTDDVFELIRPGFSVFGPLGINPNFAEAAALKSLHKAINDEVANKIIARRDNPKEGGPFKDADDFFGFLNGLNTQIPNADQEKFPLRFTEPCNFRITATGASGKAVVTVTAITYDLDCAQQEVTKKLAEEKKQQGDNGENANSGTNTAGTNNPSTKGGSSKKQGLPKGPPRIVYWNER